MSTPGVQVTIFYASTSSFGTAFVLDNATQDILDGATYTLADEVAVDVSSYLTGSLSTTRGRSREVDQYQAGSASFTLRNEDRAFDPSNTAVGTASGLKPRLRVEIAYTSDGVALGDIFTGYIDDIQVRYEQPNISMVDITCVDAFTVLATQQLRNVNISSGTPGAAINKILTSCGFSGSRNIATGYATIQASTQSSSDALTFLQTVARSDQGSLFVSKSGTLTYLDKYYSSTDYNTVGPEFILSDVQADITSGAADAGYVNISQKSATLLLFNQALGTRTGGTEQTANDTTSQATYQTRSLSLGQLEISTDSAVLDLCSYLVSRYANPEVRFDSVSVMVNGLSALATQRLVSVELADPLTVTRTPPGSGTPATLTKAAILDGISWSIDFMANTFEATFNLASMDSRTYLVLDDPTLDIIETTNRLGF